MLQVSHAWVVTALALLGAGLSGQPPAVPAAGGAQKPIYRSGVDLVHVTVTVTDGQGRFVRGLARQDFQLNEDGRPQDIVQFNAERAPVSLGIALDTSTSMSGARIREARQALARVLDSLAAGDEVCLYTFGDAPRLLIGWTDELARVRRTLDDVGADGQTALYDAVGEALRMVETGKFRKKILLVVSDGNDTASSSRTTDLRRRIGGSEAIVYAIAVDSSDPLARPNRPVAGQPVRRQAFPPRPQFPRPPSNPWPGSGRSPWDPREPPKPKDSTPRTVDTANVRALRELTDFSGGRTEVVRSTADIGQAAASVVSELGQQYQLIYQANAPRDGRWHTIEVVLRDPALTVRARKGYLAGAPPAA